MNEKQSKRLKILRPEEIKNIYGTPIFTPEDRTYFFMLDKPELKLLENFHSIRTKVYFILQLGYFKAKKQFFKLEAQSINDDFQYILKSFFKNDKDDIYTIGIISKRTRIKQQKIILNLFQFKKCRTEEKNSLQEIALTAATFCNKPIFIFKELMNYLAKMKISIPGYSFMQDTVGKAINHEQLRLTGLLKKHLTNRDIVLLQNLIDNSPRLYNITQIKREPKDFSFNEIKQEIVRGEQISELYRLAQQILLKFKISNESIKYYASLVDYYSVYKLKQLNKWTGYLYLLCYIYTRFQKVHDNLLNTLIYSTRRYKNEAKRLAKEQIYEQYKENSQNIQKAGEVFEIFLDDNTDPRTTFHEIQLKIFTILNRNDLEKLTNQFTNQPTIDEAALQWEFIDKFASRFKRYLRPIILSVDFNSSRVKEPLIEAVDFIKNAFTKRKSLTQYSDEVLPMGFIPPNIKNYLYIRNSEGRKELAVNRYEFLVYQLLWTGLESGDIYCYDSIRFRSFEEYLIGDEEWGQKDFLIELAGLSIFNQPIEEHLATLKNVLEARIESVNQHISSGENQAIKLKKGRDSGTKWLLPVDTSENTDDGTYSIFDEIPSIEITQILQYVNKKCGFLDNFVHVLGRYTKQKQDNRLLIASLIAWGTNMGLGRMGEISDVDFPTLLSTSDNFIRLETLKAANDCVSNAISKLPIFEQYNIENVIYSSSDGQKYETSISTFNSRHSSKYFGLKKGIVSYSTVANHIPINAQIIGANEHESHCVFDNLYNNSTTIQPGAIL
ncbi:Tn3 family transposase (plasmid) [Lactococcus lactis]|nr:Tn3 family transposase [Lactococcus lactis]WDA67577.1 Tn3 family transposase [Lactococcus lactis]